MKKPYINLSVPLKFSMTPKSVAEILGVHADVVRRNIARQPDDRYYLKAHQNAPGGTYIIYASDLEDYLQRTQVGGSYHEEKRLVTAV